MPRAITVTGADKWDGDPAVACHRITIETDDLDTATDRLAPLLELLDDGDELDRLLDHAAERRRAKAVRDLTHDCDEPERCPHCGAAPQLADSFGA